MIQLDQLTITGEIMLEGVDLSKYQSNNYKTIIDKYAKEFVIVRAGWRYKVDSYCDKIYQYAKSKGKKLGVYFFPLTSDSLPELHADWAYKQIMGYIGEAVFILDWEAYNGAEGKNDDSLTSWALAWLQAFEKLSGVRPLIYMNSNCERSYNWSNVVKNDNGLWIANYGNNDGNWHARPKTKYWTNPAIHQWTSAGADGVQFDRDTFYGDRKAWDKYAEKKFQVVEKPEENEMQNLKAKIEQLTKERDEAKKHGQEYYDKTQEIYDTWHKLNSLLGK